jgi:DNA-directed RNA polymerase specialized sigma24 family protein
MQLLLPRQRAGLILRDVVGFPADAVAEMLESTTASVNSALNRARATLDLVEREDGARDFTSGHGAECVVDIRE